MDNQAADDPLHAWVEWKARCARGLCSPATQTALAEFAGKRFETYVSRYISRTGIQDAWQVVRLFPPEDAWHLFEAHLCTQMSVGGKPYKDWLFARAADSEKPPLPLIEAGASIIMRDVVRRQLRTEYAPRFCISIDVEIFDKDLDIPAAATVFLGQPDAVDETAAREYHQLALQHAQEAFATMTDRERIAVLCRGTDLPLSHPAVARAAACRKSVLHEAYRTFFTRTARCMQETYPDDDTESVMALTLMLIRGVKSCIRTWARDASCCSGLRSLLEAP